MLLQQHQQHPQQQHPQQHPLQQQQHPAAGYGDGPDVASWLPDDAAADPWQQRGRSMSRSPPPPGWRQDGSGPHAAAAAPPPPPHAYSMSRQQPQLGSHFGRRCSRLPPRPGSGRGYYANGGGGRGWAAGPGGAERGRPASRSHSRSRSRSPSLHKRRRLSSRDYSRSRSAPRGRSRSYSHSCSRSRSYSRTRSRSRRRGRSDSRDRRGRGGGGCGGAAGPDSHSKQQAAAQYARVAELTRLAAMQQASMTPQALQLTRHARRVYVGNLPPSINEMGITQFFNQVGGWVGGWAGWLFVPGCQVFELLRQLTWQFGGPHSRTRQTLPLMPPPGDDGGGRLQLPWRAGDWLLPADRQALWLCGVQERGGGEQRNGL
jgi:hypothetical protein